MRRYSWLLLFLAGCGGPDADPLKVAERFHAFRLAGDDRGLHALLAEVDRAAVPLESFPMELPPRIELKILGFGDAQLDSASLLRMNGDTAAVQLHVAGIMDDTLRLVAIHDPRKLWRFELDRVRWRVALGLGETALLDSLAAVMRAGDEATAVEPARAFLATAERHPDLARPADVEHARSVLREAAVVEALQIDLQVAPSFTGNLYISGEIENPTPRRIATLRLMVRDTEGVEQKVELWEVAPESTTPVMQPTNLKRGPVSVRLDRIQVF